MPPTNAFWELIRAWDLPAFPAPKPWVARKSSSVDFEHRLQNDFVLTRRNARGLIAANRKEFDAEPPQDFWPSHDALRDEPKNAILLLTIVAGTIGLVWAVVSLVHIDNFAMDPASGLFWVKPVAVTALVLGGIGACARVASRLPGSPETILRCG